MMRKFIALLMVLVVTTSIEAVAQKTDYIGALEKLVISLRDHQGKRDAWETAVNALAAPDVPLVALLDNLVAENAAGEYHKKDADPMHLNGAVSRSFDSRKGRAKSKGDYYNSLTRGVNFSMIEKTIAPKSTVTYTLKGHSGMQQFVAIPANGEASGLKITYYLGVNPIKSTIEKSLLSRCRINSVSADQVIKIRIENPTSKPQAVAIINHNAKKQ